MKGTPEMQEIMSSIDFHIKKNEKDGIHHYNRVWEKIAAWHKEHTLKWISVKDKNRLPKTGQKVLCIQDPEKTATREALYAVFTGKDFMPLQHTIFADFTIAQSRWSDITHWQPLPETR